MYSVVLPRELLVLHGLFFFTFLNSEDNSRCDDSYGNLCSDMHVGEGWGYLGPLPKRVLVTGGYPDGVLRVG